MDRCNRLLLKFRRKKVLNNSDNISHKEAIEKTESEYGNIDIAYDGLELEL